MDETAAIVYTAPVDPSEVDDLASTFEAFVDAETTRFHGALRLLTRDRAEAEDLWSPVSITTVSNLVTHGCHDHSWADPPVGPSVDELAAALTHLAPFRVTSPPEDVSIYGYHGKYLELTVPNLPVSDDGTFTTCAEGNLKSWVAAIDAGEAGDAFYGYTGPGFTEEFWILDVEGTRLMISAGTSPGSPPEDLAELRAILDSIRIEP